MKRAERQIYYYTSRNTGERKKVYCTRLDYLFLKLYYDIDGAVDACEVHKPPIEQGKRIEHGRNKRVARQGVVYLPSG